MIQYDFREEKSALPTLFLLNDIEAQATHLPLGDYLLSDRICVERKTAPDLAQSIKSGRLFEQANRLQEEFEIPVLICENMEQAPLKKEACQGALISLIKRKIQVILVKDEEETMGWLKRLYLAEQKPASQRKRGKKKKSEDKQIQEDILMAIPGISLQLAKKLLTEFSSLQNLANQDQKEIQKIDKIGPKKAEQIVSLLQNNYNEKPW